MILWWGPDLTVLYNDGYIPMLGNKHPQRALGLPGREVWSEVWPVIEPLLMQVSRKARPNWADDMQLFINRSGYPEECYFRFSYSPISDESGGIGGVFTPVSETTQRAFPSAGCARFATSPPAAAAHKPLSMPTPAWSKQ